MLLNLAAVDLIGFCSGNDDVIAVVFQPVIHHNVVFARLMADINQEDDGTEFFPFLEIFLDHHTPFGDFRFRRLCIAVAGQVYHIHAVVDIIKIDGSCFAGLGAGTGKSFSAQHGIDERRFAYVGFARKGNFHFAVGGILGEFRSHCRQ